MQRLAVEQFELQVLLLVQELVVELPVDAKFAVQVASEFLPTAKAEVLPELVL